MKKTQHEKILEAFRRSPDKKLSMRYIERELYISQATARISELRSKGYTIVPVGEDEYGFSIQQLQDEPKRLKVEYVPVIKDGVRMVRRVETLV